MSYRLLTITVNSWLRRMASRSAESSKATLRSCKVDDVPQRVNSLTMQAKRLDKPSLFQKTKDRIQKGLLSKTLRVLQSSRMVM